MLLGRPTYQALRHAPPTLFRLSSYSQPRESQLKRLLPSRRSLAEESSTPSPNLRRNTSLRTTPQEVHARKCRGNRAVHSRSKDPSWHDKAQDRSKESWEPSENEAYERLRDAVSREDYPTVRKILRLLVYDQKLQPTLSLYLALILANTDSQNGSAEEVSNLLQEMSDSGIVADSSIFHAILKVLAVHSDYVFRAEVLQEFLHERWFTLTSDGWHDMIAGLVRDRQLERALDTVDQMQKKGMRVRPWLYDLIVYVLCEAEEFDEALRIVKRREDEGELDISPMLWSAMLESGSRALHYGLVEYVWRSRVQPSFLIPPSGLCNNVLTVAARYGDFALATDVFRVLGSRSHIFQLYQYEALLEAYVYAADIRSAMTVLCIMNSSNNVPTKASTRALYWFLRQSPSRPLEAYAILRELHSAKREIPTAAVNCIIEACIYHDDLVGAIEQYKQLHLICTAGPTTETFNVLFRGCSKASRKDLAMFLASEMLALHIAPDALTYDRLILVCLNPDPGSRSKTDIDYEDAFKYFDEMKNRDMFPRPGTITAMLKRCCEAEDYRAWELLEEMKSKGMQSTRPERWLLENWNGDINLPLAREAFKTK